MSLGVGAKLRIAFFCVSGFAIAAAVVGILALSGIETRQNQVVDQAIPSVIDAQNFANVTADLVAAPLALEAASSIAEIDAQAGVLEVETKTFLAFLNEFEKRQIANSLIVPLRPLLEELHTNLVRRTELTRLSLTLEARELETKNLAKITAAEILEIVQPLAINAYADLLKSSDRLRKTLTSQGTVDQDVALREFDQITEVDIHHTERLSDLSFRVESLYNAIDRVTLEDNPQKLQVLQRDYDQDLSNLTRLVQELPPSEAKERIGERTRQLHLGSAGPENLFDIRSARLATNAEIVAMDRAGLGVATQIDEHVARIVAAAETTINEATQQARASIAFGKYMLVFFAVGAFCASIFIGWTYVSNKILRRINNLARAMRELTAGNLDVSVADNGRDELSEMARALAIFRANAIQIRRQDQALKQSEQRFALAVQGSSVGVWDWESVTQDQEYWSPLFHSLLGYEVGEIETRSSIFRALVHPDDKQLLAYRVDAHLKRRTPYNIEIRLKHKSGEYRWFNTTGQAMWNEDGRPVRMTGSISDITERREVAALLENQAEDLRRSNAELEQFAYVASHDLQEPLRMVSSYCELLMRRYGDELDDDAKDFIRFAVDGARRMQNLVRDILQLSRVGRVSLQAEPIDLTELTHDITKDLSEMIAESKAEIKTENLPNLNVDPGLMRVVLQNLIQNGIKFRAERRPIITVSGVCCDGRHEISVSDNGIGIQPEYADRIFEIFQRLHTREEYPGTGIGLALAKRIVQRHGGEIWLDQTAKLGSTIKFTIPTREENSEVEPRHGHVEYIAGRG